MFSLFLTLRLSVLAILVYMNFLVLVFASWNVHSSVVSETPVSAAAVILILSNCASFIAVALALSELIEPKIKLSLGWVECAWAAFIGNIQIAAAIAVTVDNPTLMCRAHLWSVCASGSLLVPAAWITGVAASSYFLSLLVTIMVHRTSVPDIWTTSIYDISWFSSDLSSAHHFDPRKIPTKPEALWGRGDSVTSDDKESQRSNRPARDPPTWAQSYQVVRGKQAPFVRPVEGRLQCPTRPPARPSPPVESSALPPVTLNDASTVTRAPTPIPESSPVRPSPMSAPRPVNHPQVKESHQLQRSGTASWSSRSDLSMFPEQVKNDNLPIPKTRPSQWIRLDASVV
jgi:hypothetical protein